MEFVTYYLRCLKLLDKCCQICQTRPLCTIWNISGAICVIVLRFKLRWQLDISSFPTIYGKPNNSFRRERTTCFKLGLKNLQRIFEN